MDENILGTIGVVRDLYVRTDDGTEIVVGRLELPLYFTLITSEEGQQVTVNLGTPAEPEASAVVGAGESDG